MPWVMNPKFSAVLHCGALFSALLLAVSPAPAIAWDGIVNGKVAQIDIAQGENYGFRVTIEGWPAMCGNANNWAYLNASDSNYQAYSAAIMLAYSIGAPVSIFTTREPIGYFVLRQRS